LTVGGKIVLKKSRKKLGELLLDYKMITEDQLSKALKIQKEKNKRIGETLTELRLVTQDQINWVLSKQLDIPYVQIEKEQLDIELIKKFPAYLVKNYNLIPLIEIEGKVVVAMADPTDQEAVDRISSLYNNNIDVVFASFQNIAEIIQYLRTEYPNLWK
jgi:type IV pilus assembly protein PilB